MFKLFIWNVRIGNCTFRVKFWSTSTIYFMHWTLINVKKLINIKHKLKSLKNVTINWFNAYYYNTKYYFMQLEQLYATSIAPVLIFSGINQWYSKFIHKTPCHSRSQSELETAKQTVDKHLAVILATTKCQRLIVKMQQQKTNHTNLWKDSRIRRHGRTLFQNLYLSEFKKVNSAETCTIGKDAQRPLETEINKKINDGSLISRRTIAFIAQSDSQNTQARQKSEISKYISLTSSDSHPWRK